MADRTEVQPGEKYGVEVSYRAPSEVSIGWEDGEPYAIVSMRMILKNRDLYKPGMLENEKESILRKVTAVVLTEFKQ